MAVNHRHLDRPAQRLISRHGAVEVADAEIPKMGLPLQADGRLAWDRRRRGGSLHARKRILILALVFAGLACSNAPLAGPLQEAAAHGDIARLKELIDGGEDLASRDKDGNTALHAASLTGHGELAAVLLEAGVPIDARNHDGDTALILAESRDDDELVRKLVSHGADPDIIGSSGYAVLSEVCKKGRWDSARFLIRHGADPNAIIERMGFGGAGPLLILAVYEGEYEMVRWLLQQDLDVDVNASDTMVNMSALRHAANEGHVDIARVLLEHGANPNSRTNVRGTTPLHGAIAAQNVEIVRLLIEHGADVNAYSPDQYEEYWKSPLALARHQAFRQMRDEDPIVEMLLAHGAKMPDELSAAQTIVPGQCHSEEQVRKINGFRKRGRLARFTGKDARVFVELVFFWEYGLPEPVSDAEYDTAIAWKPRRRGIDLAPLVLFKEGCAVIRDMGLIASHRVGVYAGIVEQITENPDTDKVRHSLIKLAKALKNELEGVFAHALDVTLEEVVSEFEARLERLPSTQPSSPRKH